MPREKRKTGLHSIRCAEEIWVAAKARADAEGVYLNSVLTELLDGYGQGALDVTDVKIFTDAS